MKPLRYAVSKKAVSDLEEIWLYTVKKWSVDQADRYYNLIFDEINFICKNINAGKSMEHVRKGYFSLAVSPLVKPCVWRDTAQLINLTPRLLS
ncbi:MAG TPA: type II toxin-antitoxin system RelE/ParE family toxin [Chitinophagaceae bacterium]|nr:type II toxin-antitoxin system RelE/ParE family toxin [Chitinophagaceae bacterium]